MFRRSVAHRLLGASTPIIFSSGQSILFTLAFCENRLVSALVHQSLVGLLSKPPYRKIKRRKWGVVQMMPSYVSMPALTALGLVLVTQQALGAGFAIREQSATAQTSAFAGATAAAKDPSYMFFNPAALALQEGSQAHLSLSYILPESKFKDGEASIAGGAVPIVGTDNAGDIGDDALVPAIYLSTQPA